MGRRAEGREHQDLRSHDHSGFSGMAHLWPLEAKLRDPDVKGSLWGPGLGSRSETHHQSIVWPASKDSVSAWQAQ